MRSNFETLETKFGKNIEELGERLKAALGLLVGEPAETTRDWVAPLGHYIETHVSKKVCLGHAESLSRRIIRYLRKLHALETNDSYDHQETTEYRIWCGRTLLELFDYSYQVSVQMTFAYLNVLSLFKVISIDDEPFESLWHQIHQVVTKWLIYGLHGDLEKYLKYHTCFLTHYAIGNKTAAPKRPDFLPFSEVDGCFLSGNLFRRVRTKLIRKNRNAVQLAYSLQQCKSASPKVHWGFLEQCREENAVLLTTVQEPKRDDRTRAYEIYCEIEGAVRRTAREARGSTVLKPVMMIPSMSASYEFSRKEGGSFGVYSDWIRENLDGCEIVGDLVTKEGKSVPVKWPAREEIFQELIPVVDPIPLKVNRVVLPEALKGRTITMGPTVEYQGARSYQKPIWRLLQKFECFALTGRPDSVQDIERVVEFGKDLFGLEFDMVSGDYKSATDNLNPDLSRACMEELSEGLDEDVRANLINALINHVIDANECHGGIPQRWGQTMGSPVSFPVLCLINAAVTRLVLEKVVGRKIKLSQLGLLINGDDILFPLPTDKYELWTEYVTAAGLAPSVGKNFVVSFPTEEMGQIVKNRAFCTVNSQIYDVQTYGTAFGMKGLRMPARVCRIPIVNSGLLVSLNGQSWGHSGKSDRTEKAFQSKENCVGIDARCQTLIAGHSFEIQCQLMTDFLYLSRHVLKNLPPVSYWVAVTKGGLGFPFRHISKSMPDISEAHRKMAAHLSTLTPDGRKSQMKLGFLRNPGTCFSKTVVREEERLAEALGVPLVVKQVTVDDSCPAGKEILIGALHVGADIEIQSKVSFLKKWCNWTKSSIAKAQRISLQPMGIQKSMIPLSEKLVRDWTDVSFVPLVSPFINEEIDDRKPSPTLKNEVFVAQSGTHPAECPPSP